MDPTEWGKTHFDNRDDKKTIDGTDSTKVAPSPHLSLYVIANWDDGVLCQLQKSRDLTRRYVHSPLGHHPHPFLLLCSPIHIGTCSHSTTATCIVNHVEEYSSLFKKYAMSGEDKIEGVGTCVAYFT